MQFTYHREGGGTVVGNVVYNDTPFEFLTGDYNYDGVVNASDYMVWRSSYGSTTQLFADGNHGGVVDAADYAVWRDNLGATGSATGDLQLASQQAPEPASGLLTIVALCAVIRNHRRAV